jgi:hypothetical protein
MEKKVIARIAYPANSSILTAELSKLGKLEFYSIDGAKFSGDMSLATVELDDDHMIYILVEESVVERIKELSKLNNK